MRKLKGLPRKPPPVVRSSGGWEPKPRPVKVNPPGPHVEDVAEYWRRYLPRPPASSQSDEEVGRWIDDVAYAGGGAALAWLRMAENWPKSLGSVMRGRLSHHVEKLYNDANDAARKASLRATEDKLAQQEAERRERQREAGW